MVYGAVLGVVSAAVLVAVALEGSITERNRSSVVITEAGQSAQVSGTL